jgi:hypothetical protein
MAIEDRLRDDPEPVSPEQVMRYRLREDDRIESIAARIHEADDVDELESESSEDLREVVELADEIQRTGVESRLIVLREGEDPAYVVDGNHRAVAHVLHLLRGGEFEGQDAYLGVRT